LGLLMSTINKLRASLASVRAELDEAVGRLKQPFYDWAPEVGMRTIHGQLVEIASTEEAMIRRIKGNPAKSFSEVEDPMFAIGDLKAMIQVLANVRTETLKLLDSMSEEDLNLPVSVTEGFAQYMAMDPKSVTVEDMFHMIVRHESYHCGQLVSYLWAHGDDPYQW
jgi:uncharacterized damage-inducible protein DinB